MYSLPWAVDWNNDPSECSDWILLDQLSLNSGHWIMAYAQAPQTLHNCNLYNNLISACRVQFLVTHLRIQKQCATTKNKRLSATITAAQFTIFYHILNLFKYSRFHSVMYNVKPGASSLNSQNELVKNVPSHAKPLQRNLQPMDLRGYKV